jgi:hypothetical protein
MRALLIAALALCSFPAHAQMAPTFEQLADFLPPAPDGWDVSVLDQTEAMGGPTAVGQYMSDDDFFMITFSASTMLSTLYAIEPATVPVGEISMAENEGGLMAVVGQVAVSGMPGDASRELLLEALASVDFAAMQQLSD